MTAYRFKLGTRIKRLITSVTSEIKRATVHESIDIKQIVSNSEPEDAPLHRELEWSNSLAANKWRSEKGVEEI